MTESKQENGYFKASKVGAKPLNGAIPGIGNVSDWSKGDIKRAFFAPHEGIPGIKVSAATTATTSLKGEGPAATAASAKPQADEPAAPKETASTIAQEELSAAKPELKIPEPPQAKAPIIVPLELAPVVAAGVLKGAHDQARGKPSSQSTDLQDVAEFQLGNYSTATRRARYEQAFRDQLVARDTDHGNNRNSELLEQLSFNEYMRQMEAYLDDRMAYKQREIEQIQQNLARIDEDLRLQEDRRDQLQTGIAVDQTQLDATNETIAQLETRIREQEEKIKESEARRDQTTQKIEELEQTLLQQAQDLKDADDKIKESENDAADAFISQAVSQSDQREGRRAIESLQASTSLLEKEVADAAAKPFLDKDGRAVHKDKDGNYYAQDNQGNRVDYSAAEQEELKNKATEEKLLTPEEIEETRKRIEANKENIARLTKEEEEHRQNSQKYGDRFKSAEEARAFYKERREVLQEQISAGREQHNSLTERLEENNDALNTQKAELEALKQKLAQANDNKTVLMQQIADKQKMLQETQAKIDDLNRQKLEQTEKLIAAQKDLKTMNEMRDAVRAAKTANTPEERQAAREKIAQLKANMSPEEKARFEEYDQKAEARLKAEQQAAQQKASAPQQTTQVAATPQQTTQAPASAPAAQTAQTAHAPTAQPVQKAVAASADNTSRVNGSASEAVVTASTRAGPPFTDAAHGVTPPAPAEMTPDQILTADHTQRNQPRSNGSSLTA